MSSKMLSDFAYLIFYILTLTTFPKLVQCNTSLKARPVFPNDVVKFPCKKSLSPSLKMLPKTEECVWNFYESEAPPSASTSLKQITTACIKAIQKNNSTRDGEGTYIGYLEVPEKARSIWCTGDDNPTPLLLQNARVAEPISRFDNPTPQIILQRFSGDFAIRFGVHDVTNETIYLDGQEVSSVKLYCVNTAEVAWTNYSETTQKLLKQMKNRDLQWLEYSSHEGLAKKWKTYLYFLRHIEEELVNVAEFRLAREQTIFTAPLAIRNLTDQSSRTYECRSIHNDTVYVTLEVQYPRSIGPDEIYLIQQIIAIIDSLAQGNSKGPWYTLGSFMSIFLILFGYYCKKKLEQPSSESTKPVPANPPIQEDVEQRVQLRNAAATPQVIELENPLSNVSTPTTSAAVSSSEVTVKKAP